MASGQLGIIPVGLINNDKIVKPGTEYQIQLHRDEAAAGSGTYYGKLSDGTEEPIGGPGSTSTSIAVEITSADGLALASVVTGGTAPYTYSWLVKSKFINGTDIAFTGATNAATAAIDNSAPTYDGTVAVKVTDVNGKVAYGYWHTRKDNLIP